MHPGMVHATIPPHTARLCSPGYEFTAHLSAPRCAEAAFAQAQLTQLTVEAVKVEPGKIRAWVYGQVLHAQLCEF